ncbi:NAD(P)-binding protein [Mollisia scopiformis]|uniref:NAD(P)-binding protein n=1 Tax=Mollisia scopiformis TaxID=149040 RepID=A0A132B9B0_MOLSC|nr:NAD(P)-binding protein [Mollisia scopiformis]KUJ08843.1 NAD(P)-binding protein [Mollisia scopiformis]
MAVSDKFYAIVAGVGPGTGRSAAIRFSEAYPVVLLARSPESYKDVVAEINKGGRKAIGITADATDEAALKAAFETIKKEIPGLKLAAAIYNIRPNSRPSRKPFLELTSEDLDVSLKGNIHGLFNFGQSVIPLLLESVEGSPHPPSLIVTGATASIRGSKLWSVIAAGKSGQRILAQSLAREFGPQGVHVAHAIIDGGIDVPDATYYPRNEGTPETKISPYAIAESYWFLHTQHKSAFSQEIDLRPFIEKF